MPLTRRLFLSVLAFASLLSPLLAQRGPAAEAPLKVEVACDRADWLYTPGESVTFTIKVTAGNGPLAGAKVSYSFGPEMMTAERKNATAELSAEGTHVLDGGTLHVPGFLRCIATVEHGGTTQRGLATAGFLRKKSNPRKRSRPISTRFGRRRRPSSLRSPSTRSSPRCPRRATTRSKSSS